MVDIELSWCFVAIVCMVVVALYSGIGATLGFVFTYLTLRPLTLFDDEQGHPRSTAFGLALLGALAGGAPNFVVSWLVTAT